MKRKEITITDVAIEAGVSIATVSRVINHSQRVEPSAAKRVREAMHNLNYVPKKPKNPNALIAFLIPSFENPFFASIAEGVMQQANKNDQRMVVLSSEGNAAQEAHNLRSVAKMGVNALIFCPLSDTSAELLPSLFPHSLPIVILYRHDYYNLASHIYYDNIQGGYLATKYLLKSGHRNIAFFASFWGETPTNLLEKQDERLMGSYSSLDRLEGYKNALSEFDIEVKAELLCSTGYNYESGYAKAKLFLSSLCDFTAIICCNDAVAAGVLQAIEEQNIDVPRQVSIIGYDDSFLTEITRPALSSMHQDPLLLGKRAFTHMQELLSGKEKGDIVLQPSLKIKSSTGQCES